jgi:hypothetical protein
MDNNDFKIRIIDFYKNVDKPLLNDLTNNDSFKNILELSTISEIPLLKKEKKNWNLKDKKIILKQIESSKKKKIKDLKNNLSKIDTIKINDIKEKNNKLLTELETINLLKNTIEDDKMYHQLSNLSKLTNETILAKKVKGGKKKYQNGGDFTSIKVIDIEEKKNIEKINIGSIIPKEILSSESDEFIEIFSN